MKTEKRTIILLSDFGKRVFVAGVRWTDAEYMGDGRSDFRRFDFAVNMLRFDAASEEDCRHWYRVVPDDAGFFVRVFFVADSPARLKRNQQITASRVIRPAMKVGHFLVPRARTQRHIGGDTFHAAELAQKFQVESAEYGRPSLRSSN